MNYYFMEYEVGFPPHANGDVIHGSNRDPLDAFEWIKAEISEKTGIPFDEIHVSQFNKL